MDRRDAVIAVIEAEQRRVMRSCIKWAVADHGEQFNGIPAMIGILVSTLVNVAAVGAVNDNLDPRVPGAMKELMALVERQFPELGDLTPEMFFSDRPPN